MNSNKSESGTGTIFFKIKIKLIETLFTAKSRIVRKPIPISISQSPQALPQQPQQSSQSMGKFFTTKPW